MKVQFVSLMIYGAFKGEEIQLMYHNKIYDTNLHLTALILLLIQRVMEEIALTKYL